MSRRVLTWSLRVAALAAAPAAAALWADELPFPPPHFEAGYSLPAMRLPPGRAAWRDAADTAALAAALGLAAWLALARRSRRGLFWLSAASLLYFGFVRHGCICPIGATQNVALALADSSYRIPWAVVLFFVLPLLAALLFGRVFCAAVCPLGAVQDLALVKPLRAPRPLAHALSLIPYLYLGAAVMLAATDTLFLICRYDPFVAFFRFGGSLSMLLLGAGFVALSTFVGRPYCRFVCPYGALLGLFSRVAWRKVSITPAECVACSLCHDACPFDAIESPTPPGAEEEA